MSQKCMPCLYRSHQPRFVFLSNVHMYLKNSFPFAKWCLCLWKSVMSYIATNHFASRSYKKKINNNFKSTWHEVFKVFAKLGHEKYQNDRHFPGMCMCLHTLKLKFQKITGTSLKQFKNLHNPMHADIDYLNGNTSLSYTWSSSQHTHGGFFVMVREKWRCYTHS